MKTRFGLLLILISCGIFAYSPNTDQPLSTDQAFQFSAAAHDRQTILARWNIAPGYYLYRKQFSFHIIKPKNARLGQPLFPKGIKKNLPNLGHCELYKDTITIPLPIISTTQDPLTLEVYYQGCSEAGYCYPPTKKIVTIDLNKDYMTFIKGSVIDIPNTNTHSSNPLPPPNKIQQLLKGDHLWAFLIGFLSLGLLIALTPCVLPMIPILSAIIVGQKKLTSTHAFLLSLFYVFGMAITYAIAGVLAGLLGSSFQTVLQTPWVIALFSALFIAMALSLFGFYEIQIPSRWHSRLTHWSEHQKQGTYAGVFVMGILSTLILSPCATPALIGVLSYISHTGNATLGGLALFIMAIGMGFPLLIIGFCHGKLIPKAGIWMNTIKTSMGILMLAMAIWLLQRILTATVTMWLWALLALGTSLYLMLLSKKTKKWGHLLCKTLSVLIFTYGILLTLGAVTGYNHPLTAWKVIQINKTQQAEPLFKKVSSVAEINTAITLADQQQKPVILDFWAQWCISCQQMDSMTFANPKVQRYLKKFILLRADITKNNKASVEALKQHFNIIAPPTLLFFKEGQELKQARLIGEIKAPFLLKHLQQITQN